MDRDQPVHAPAPRRGMTITGGFCPEFWRWRVSACSDRGITLTDRKGRVRILPDQWLPWLAGRCRRDVVYVDGQRIEPPAAVPLVLPGDDPEPAAPYERPSQRKPTDIASLLRQAREVLKHYRIYDAKVAGRGKLVHVDGVLGSYRVWYDVEQGRLPLCNCHGVMRAAPSARVCKHGLAVLLQDPTAKVLLLRALD